VIGVGGFLGFGKKDVAVPFSAMQWRTEVRKVRATDQPTPMTATSGQQPPPMKETDPAATEASQGYPDKAILNVTLAELKAAPDFKYAPSPLDEAILLAVVNLNNGSVTRSTIDSLAQKSFSWTAFCAPFNMTGQPAMSVPLYWNKDNLPIGTHLVARFGEEATLFRVAAQLEQAQPWSTKRPAVWAGLPLTVSA